jgi:branched-chain amino acid transport system substrate-binding protein
MQKWQRGATALTGVALTAVIFAGCGGGSGSGPTGNKNLVIATELAVSGTDAAAQLPTQYGTDLAVMQNADLGNGYKLSVKHYNYEGTSGPDPSIGSSDVTAAAADPTIMAIMGPFNSGVAKVEIPIITQAGLVEISPANTNPGLTLSQYAADNGIVFSNLHPAGIPEYYFRIPGNDVVQGKVDAQVAAGAPVNAKSCYVVDDDTTYGKGLAKYFTSTFTGNGGTVAGTASITAAQIASLPSLAATIKNKNPDCVFYGGVTSGGGGALKKDLVSAGYTAPMVGGDGIADDPGFVTAAGAAAANTYGSVAAPDNSQFTSGPAAAFVTAYKAAFPGKDLLPYSAMAYDATMIEIKAIRDQIASISYTGVTGTISFDANGDNAGTKVFSIYGVDSTGMWTFKQQINA